MNYDKNDRFSFAGIKIGTAFNDIMEQLGQPAALSIDSDQQQPLLYKAHLEKTSPFV